MTYEETLSPLGFIDVVPSSQGFTERQKQAGSMACAKQLPPRISQGIRSTLGRTPLVNGSFLTHGKERWDSPVSGLPVQPDEPAWGDRDEIGLAGPFRVIHDSTALDHPATTKSGK